MYVFIFITVIIIPLMMVFFGKLWIKNPPKSINYIYGYRTRRSMKNKETWDFAHKYIGKIWYKLGLVIGIISAIAFLLFNKSADNLNEKSIIVILIGQLIFMIAPIFITESALKRKFKL